MRTQKPFSWAARAKSFAYAWAGIKAVFRSEHNMWLHGVSTVAATVLGILVRVRGAEAVLLAMAMALVWLTELFNTAIEKLADVITIEQHPQIKLVKDLAAAAVLVAAFTAAIAGCFIFIPKLFFI